MRKKTEKKTDRRTLYTKRVIREAFLELKCAKEFNDITVADICRLAEISRGTFYLHYHNTSEVLEEILDEALSVTKSLGEQLYPASCGEHQCGYPLCQHIRNSREYRCLFFDDALASRIIEKIYAAHKEEIVRLWAERTSLSQEQLVMLAYFQLSGCFAAAKKSESWSDESWEQTQTVIDRFLRSGIQSLSEK